MSIITKVVVLELEKSYNAVFKVLADITFADSEYAQDVHHHKLNQDINRINLLANFVLQFLYVYYDDLEDIISFIRLVDKMVMSAMTFYEHLYKFLEFDQYVVSEEIIRNHEQK
jgi:hypothetical protein